MSSNSLAERDRRLTTVDYRILDHTGDAGVEFRAETLDSLFANAGVVLFDMICGAERIEPSGKCVISVDGGDYETLMFNFMAELIYQFDALKRVFSSFRVTEIDEARLIAEGFFEHYSPQRHGFKFAIKAVTMHQLTVKREKDGYYAKIIFDL